MDDARLIEAAQANPEAFADLYRRHVTRVYRYHLAHTGNVKDAEDLTSQTFIAALEGMRHFRGSGSVLAWLFGIAANKRAMFFRGRKAEVPLEEGLDLPARENPEHETEQRMQHTAIFNALKQISPDRAEALILVYFGGLGYEEAADVLHRNTAAVRMLASRGLSDLRERSALRLEVTE